MPKHSGAQLICMRRRGNRVSGQLSHQPAPRPTGQGPDAAPGARLQSPCPKPDTVICVLWGHGSWGLMWKNGSTPSHPMPQNKHGSITGRSIITKALKGRQEGACMPSGTQARGKSRALKGSLDNSGHASLAGLCEHTVRGGEGSSTLWKQALPRRPQALMFVTRDAPHTSVRMKPASPRRRQRRTEKHREASQHLTEHSVSMITTDSTRSGRLLCRRVVPRPRLWKGTCAGDSRALETAP